VQNLFLKYYIEALGGRPIIYGVMQVPVYIEQGSKRLFACAIDWPGWCRSGRDEAGALDALADYAQRYEPVAREAGEYFKAEGITFVVIERVHGSATTDFGAPGAIPKADSRTMDPREAGRIVRLVAAAWSAIDRAVLASPEALRKGPRGGGRDRDKIVAHVDEAQRAYASKLGVHLAKHMADSRPQRDAIRTGLLSNAGDPNGTAWPVAYAARRIAWHALDHAWEIEDRAVPAENIEGEG
jgi:hypothetical protein